MCPRSAFESCQVQMRVGVCTASPNPILVGHTHPPGLVLALPGESGMASAVCGAQQQLQDRQFHLEPRDPRKPPLLKATKSFHSPGQTLCKCNGSLQLRKGDVPKKMNTADPWEPGNRSGLGAGHCTLLLLKNNERCSVLTAVNWGQLLTHSEGAEVGQVCFLPPPSAQATNPPKN